jgi:Zn finger protein HypA/HybF involved in hydrogenase expression
MQTFGEYIAKKITENGKINPTELQQIMREQAKNHGVPVTLNIKVECPECLEMVNVDELNVFGGICEKCNSEE